MTIIDVVMIVNCVIPSKSLYQGLRRRNGIAGLPDLVVVGIDNYAFLLTMLNKLGNSGVVEVVITLHDYDIPNGDLARFRVRHANIDPGRYLQETWLVHDGQVHKNELADDSLSPL